MTARHKFMDNIKVKPAPGYILIKPIESEKTTASGIVLPESHEEKPQQGKVLAVGAEATCGCDDKGCQKEAPCKNGDIVIYKQWGASEIKIEGKEYLIAKFEDILATLD